MLYLYALSLSALGFKGLGGDITVFISRNYFYFLLCLVESRRAKP